MNINDIEVPENIPTNIWKAIFDKQKEIAYKYKEIEGMGNLLDEKDNINTSVGQKWIKDFAWRVTEEICEALEAKKLWISKYTGNEQDLKEVEQIHLHYKEEMIDALHFLTELTIIAGYNEELFRHSVLPTLMNEWDVVYNLGLMCNCLKNKPWKQTQMLTDKAKFQEYLLRTWLYYIAVMFDNNMNIQDIYKIYFKKNEVNQFRIRSKY